MTAELEKERDFFLRYRILEWEILPRRKSLRETSHLLKKKTGLIIIIKNLNQLHVCIKLIFDYDPLLFYRLQEEHLKAMVRYKEEKADANVELQQSIRRDKERWRK